MFLWARSWRESVICIRKVQEAPYLFLCHSHFFLCKSRWILHYIHISWKADIPGYGNVCNFCVFAKSCEICQDVNLFHHWGPISSRKSEGCNNGSAHTGTNNIWITNVRLHLRKETLLYAYNINSRTSLICQTNRRIEFCILYFRGQGLMQTLTILERIIG